MSWRLHGCPACGGALYLDVEDLNSFTCLMCARSYRVADPVLELHRDSRQGARSAPVDPCKERPWLEGCGEAA